MIRVLGGVAITAPATQGDRSPIPHLERKARELLTLLVLHVPAALGAEELVRLLWEEPPVSSLRTLRSHVSRVRGVLASVGYAEAVVSARGDSYRLAADVDTDVARMTHLRRRARQLVVQGRHDEGATLLAEAREWWRGAPVLPATVAGMALQTGWERERRVLAGEHLEAVVRGSRPADALRELARLTADDPLDEPAWVLYVTALHRLGRQADALAAVATARQALVGVGLGPGVELESAHAHVLAGPATRSPSATSGRADGPDPVRYTPDGATAYLELPGHRADDTPTVLVLNPAMVTIDGLLDEPHVEAVLARLGERVRLVGLDRRGIGLSAPLAPGTDPLSQWVQDVAAVSEHAGLYRPVVLANFDTGLVAMEYAARHPDALAGLVLVNCYARYRRGEGYPYGSDPTTADELIAAAVDTSGTRTLDTSVLVAPTLATDPGFRAWWNRIGRRGANPTTARIVREFGTTLDLRGRLGAVTCPALVVPRRQCANVDPAHSAYLAEHLPHAELRPVDGSDAVWFSGSDVVEMVTAFARAT